MSKATVRMCLSTTGFGSYIWLEKNGPYGFVILANSNATTAVNGLATVLAQVLSDPEARAAFQRAAPGHLAEHGSERIARLYLEALEAALPARCREGGAGGAGAPREAT